MFKRLSLDMIVRKLFVQLLSSDSQLMIVAISQGLQQKTFVTDWFWLKTCSLLVIVTLNNYPKNKK